MDEIGVVGDIPAIRERLQNSVNWMMEGRKTGECVGVADFQTMIRFIDSHSAELANAQGAYLNMREWAEKNGVNTASRNNPE